MKRNKYSQEELVEFRQIIMDKLSKAQSEYEELQDVVSDAASRTREGGMVTVDESSEVEERETLSELAVRQAKFIQNLKRALERIENGTYGICVVTGNLIDKERLRLVPHTTHSVEAKQNRH